MNPYNYNLSFRLRHPTRDLSSIFNKLSNLTGFIPKRIWKAGELRQTPKGKKTGGNYDFSYCYFSFFNDMQESEVENLSSAVERVVGMLSSESDILLEFNKLGGILTFSIGWYIDANSGEIFDSNLLKKLVDLGIGLEFDIYPADEKVFQNRDE